MKQRQHITATHPAASLWWLTLLAACGGGGSKSNEPIIVFDGMAFIASSRSDATIGTDKRDLILDLEGAGTVHGEGGNDVIHAEGRAPIIYGGAGNDYITASGTSPGTIYGGAGHDIILFGLDSHLRELIAVLPQSSFLESFVITDSFTLDEIFETSPQARLHSATATIRGETDNDWIWVWSAPTNNSFHDIDAGGAADHIVITQNSRVITGAGQDTIYLLLEADPDGFIADDLLLIISDFRVGEDKLVISVEEGFYDGHYSGIKSWLTNGALIDFHGDGVEDDLHLYLPTTFYNENNDGHTIILENIGARLSASDIVILDSETASAMYDEAFHQFQIDFV